MGYRKKVFPVLAFCIVLTLVLAACGGGGSDKKNGNTSPVANAGLDQTVTTGDLVTLTGSGTDADGDTSITAGRLSQTPEARSFPTPTRKTPRLRRPWTAYMSLAS